MRKAKAWHLQKGRLLFNNDMCRISLETVRRANERTIRRLSAGGSLPKRRLGDDIVVSTSYNGKIFEQRIPMEKVKRAFAQAQRIADGKYGKGL
ncbi:MAG: hypothetical protein IJ637_06740 [Prevotella sp.]|nr:hypothetical protein [Prevotella sp.]